MNKHYPVTLQMTLSEFVRLADEYHRCGYALQNELQAFADSGIWDDELRYHVEPLVEKLREHGVIIPDEITKEQAA